MTGGHQELAVAETLICPVTGLPVEHRPEWSITALGDGFRLNYSRIGDNILLSQPEGYATRVDMERAVEFIGAVINEAFPDGRPIVEIGDPSRLTGMSLAARRTYVRYLQNFGRHAGLVFMGTSPLFEMAIRLGMRLNLVKYPVKIAGDYAEAITLALNMLPAEGTRGPAAMGDGGDASPAPVSRDDWRLDLEGLSTRFEAISGDVLHSVSSGYLTREHLEPVAELRRRVISSLISASDIKYFIAGVDEIEGATRRARREYLDSIKRWHESHPLRMYILYGANWFVRTAARLAGPFAPFKIAVARDLTEALRMVAEDKARLARTQSGPAQRVFADEPAPGPELSAYVEELLQYIGGINWEAGGIDLTVAPDHPFKSVFDALKLIKGELDELFSEREKVEQALRESESRYRHLVETAAEAVVVIQGDRLVLVNSTAEKITGWSKEELTSRPFLELIHPEDRDHVMERYRQRFAGEDVPDQNRYRILTKDGLEKWIEVAGVLIDWNGQPASLIMATDVTKRQQAEEERERLIAELQEALVKVKTLRGLIPICASCKKIRDDKGYWKQVEDYVGEHSDAEFSHGLCPDCLRRFYPDYVEESDFEYNQD